MTENPKVGLDRSKTGRAKGTPNKTTALLKDAILKAATEAGGADGLVGYLRIQATENPGPFMSLLGKVLPMQVAGDPNNPIVHMVRREIVRANADNPNG
ncbi:hypothetical protein [Rhizobium hidalgonense]|uniref:hypothetical protein n=1 Tax=Rhizobium hidalgonense TaxID=1538159 RepID=UPI00287145FD|nr:hypothetical protein [Rhizobium hidalgonense]MDR9813101.1 hypothetical protein [Rhizobium hidalgonense]